MLLLNRFATTRSGIPSPLKSAVATPAGLLPAATGLPVAAVNLPLPFGVMACRNVAEPLPELVASPL